MLGGVCPRIFCHVQDEKQTVLKHQHTGQNGPGATAECLIPFLPTFLPVLLICSRPAADARNSAPFGCKVNSSDRGEKQL